MLNVIVDVDKLKENSNNENLYVDLLLYVYYENQNIENLSNLERILKDKKISRLNKGKVFYKIIKNHPNKDEVIDLLNRYDFYKYSYRNTYLPDFTESYYNKPVFLAYKLSLIKDSKKFVNFFDKIIKEEKEEYLKEGLHYLDSHRLDSIFRITETVLSFEQMNISNALYDKVLCFQDYLLKNHNINKNWREKNFCYEIENDLENLCKNLTDKNNYYTIGIIERLPQEFFKDFYSIKNGESNIFGKILLKVENDNGSMIKVKIKNNLIRSAFYFLNSSKREGFINYYKSINKKLINANQYDDILIEFNHLLYKTVFEINNQTLIETLSDFLKELNCQSVNDISRINDIETLIKKTNKGIRENNYTIVDLLRKYEENKSLIAVINEKEVIKSNKMMRKL